MRSSVQLNQLIEGEAKLCEKQTIDSESCLVSRYRSACCRVHSAQFEAQLECVIGGPLPPRAQQLLQAGHVSCSAICDG